MKNPNAIIMCIQGREIGKIGDRSAFKLNKVVVNVH